MERLPVLYLQERVWRLVVDPEHVNQMRLHDEALERIRSGESTIEQEWGEPISADELRARIMAR